MPMIADTHLHFYPCYDLDHAFRRLSKNLSRLAGGYEPEPALIAFLTERHDCRFFLQLRDGKRKPHDASITIEKSAESNCIRVNCDGTELHLVAGRQINTLERIEILALTVDLDIPDGLPAHDVVIRIHDAGGVPVVSWAPGKWLAKRGDIVRELLRNAQPGTLLVGDTTLRPVGWATPLLMRAASRQGLNVIAGSDPLPFAGEERYMGTYGSHIDASLDVDAPVNSLRCALKDGRVIEQVGQRCRPMPWTLRLLRNMRVKQ
jgi:hypothetical protein